MRSVLCFWLTYWHNHRKIYFHILDTVYSWSKISFYKEIPGTELNEFELRRWTTYSWFKLEPPIQSERLSKN